MDKNAVLIDISKLSPNPLQPRGQILLDTIDELIQSIKIHGVLEPLVIAETPAGMQIIAGERRWRAAVEAGLKQVPCVVKKTTPQGMLEMAIVENVQRTNLNPIERANAYSRLFEEFGLAMQEIANRIGKSESYVSNTLRLLLMPDAVKDGLVSGAISEGHARALAGLDSAQDIVDAFKETLKRNLSVRQVEEMVRRLKLKGEEERRKFEKKQKVTLGAEMEKWRTALAQKIQGNLTISRSNKRTKLTIIFSGTLDQTEEKLKRLYGAIMK